jgi:predicted cupin superfamily sugar epimerase
VSWDSKSMQTKLNVQPPPTQTTSYECLYVGADTNSTASVKVLGSFKFISCMVTPVFTFTIFEVFLID